MPVCYENHLQNQLFLTKRRMHTHITNTTDKQENDRMLTITRRLQRPLMYVAALLWISYAFLHQGIVAGIVSVSIMLIIASVTDTKS